MRFQEYKAQCWQPNWKRMNMYVAAAEKGIPKYKNFQFFRGNINNMI